MLNADLIVQKSCMPTLKANCNKMLGCIKSLFSDSESREQLLGKILSLKCEWVSRERLTDIEAVDTKTEK